MEGIGLFLFFYFVINAALGIWMFSKIEKISSFFITLIFGVLGAILSALVQIVHNTKR